ncbi:Protein phosphatase PP2A regulatory subunit B, partial [Teratosphaeriaceae sp. CCFEE 6253]
MRDTMPVDEAEAAAKEDEDEEKPAAETDGDKAEAKDEEKKDGETDDLEKKMKTVTIGGEKKVLGKSKGFGF